jgi:UDP-3-O-[3-hydroxymyristoyl] glucosamine N-acyltransferase
LRLALAEGLFMQTVESVARSLGFDYAGDGSVQIEAPMQPAAATERHLALAMDPKFLSKIKEGSARAAMVPPDFDWKSTSLDAVIFAPRARYAMAGVTALFSPDMKRPAERHICAVVDQSAIIADSAHIGAFAVIEEGAQIGAGVLIGSHVCIGPGAIIGANSVIKSGTRIGARVAIGDRVIIHENTVVGADGFSFVTPEKGAIEIAREGGGDPFVAPGAVWARIHSLGSVIVGDDVEIGASVTIDRGTVADTRIGAGTKIDNQVQIGHNVVIGENCLLCGQTGVAGSAELGDRVVLGGQSGVADHVKIGHDVMVMASAGVSGHTKPQSIVGGTPAVARNLFVKQLMAMRKLPRVVDDVAALKKRFSSRKASG